VFHLRVFYCSWWGRGVMIFFLTPLWKVILSKMSDLFLLEMLLLICLNLL